MMVTSRPEATASRHNTSASSLARPYDSRGRHGVSSVTGLESGIPNTALDDVCTTLPTPASRAATSKFAVPTTFTDQNSSRSRANGTCATLCNTTSTPSHAARTASRSRTSPWTNSTEAAVAAGGFTSKTRTRSPLATAPPARTSPK